MNTSFLNTLTLAARALKFARSVPLRLGVSRVPRTCYGFCVRGLCGATTRLVLKRRWLRSGVIRSPLRPDCPTGFGGGIPSPNLHPCAVYLSLASELEVDLVRVPKILVLTLASDPVGAFGTR